MTFVIFILFYSWFNNLKYYLPENNIYGGDSFILWAVKTRNISIPITYFLDKSLGFNLWITLQVIAFEMIQRTKERASATIKKKVTYDETSDMFDDRS